MTDRIIPAIDKRRARRALSDHPISRELIETVLRAAHWAPSCSNNQPWRFVAVNDPDMLGRVKRHLSRGNDWAKPSPLIIAVVSRQDLDCEIPDGRVYYLFGCGLAAMNLMVQAAELGLIAHPIAGFKQAPVKNVLGVPDSYELITLIILGYPSGDVSALSDKHQAEEASERIRRPLNEVVCWNRWTFATDET
ncbi:nitroreductase family protein [Candidatus Bipolaricaulota bacterium]|nr:nitroreductase family protein [Candidatus Bipolaricaulota bacterium]